MVEGGRSYPSHHNIWLVISHLFEFGRLVNFYFEKRKKKEIETKTIGKWTILFSLLPHFICLEFFNFVLKLLQFIFLESSEFNLKFQNSKDLVSNQCLKLNLKRVVNKIEENSVNYRSAVNLFSFSLFGAYSILL